VQQAGNGKGELGEGAVQNHLTLIFHRLPNAMHFTLKGIGDLQKKSIGKGFC
jgi:hypothetical protein